MHSMVSGVALFAGLAVLQGAGVAGRPGVVETAHLTATASTSAATVAPGGRVSLYLDVSPKPRMHVYAPDQDAYLPVSLTMSTAPGLTTRPAVFPKGEPFVFEPTAERQLVFSEPFRIDVPVTIARSTAPGPRTLSATLQYQACDDRVCYIPKKITVRWEIRIK